MVLNWCAETDSAACVASLLAEAIPGLDVLIVDNASPDGSGDRLARRFPDLSFMQTGDNLGYAGGNLRAMEWALERSYDYVLICNDDAEVRAGCVGALVHALESDPEAAASAPTIVHGDDESRIWWAGGEWERYKAMGTHERFGEHFEPAAFANRAPELISFVCGCVVLFRSEALRACGGFRAEFFAYVEDLEMSVRLQAHGWKLLWVPRALAVHKVPFPPPDASAFAIRLRDRNRRRLVQLHYGMLRSLVFAAWFYPTRVVHFSRYLLQRDWPRAQAIVRGALAA